MELYGSYYENEINSGDILQKLNTDNKYLIYLGFLYNILKIV